MIYLWVDIINDEEDEEFMNIYNNLINKINDENALNEILEENKEKKPNNYIDKMTYNLTNDKLDLDNFENNPEKTDSANTENEYNENNLSYYILNINTDTQKEIIIKKNFLKWKENSCRFDSFIFLYNYGISHYISEKEIKSKNNIFFNFINDLINEYETNADISFLEYYQKFGNDFLNIKNDDKEWKKENTISSFISKLANINCFQTKYVYKTGKKCRHILKKIVKENSYSPLFLV